MGLCWTMTSTNPSHSHRHHQDVVGTGSSLMPAHGPAQLQQHPTGSHDKPWHNPIWQSLKHAAGQAPPSQSLLEAFVLLILRASGLGPREDAE